MAKRILVADDSTTIQQAFAMVFAAQDVEVTAARSFDEAVASAKKSRPDLVVTDTSLAGRTGYELCAAIKSDGALHGVPVYVLASTHVPYDESAGTKAGADGHFLKPFDSQQLIDRVLDALSKPVAAAVSTTPPPVRVVAPVPAPAVAVAPAPARPPAPARVVTPPPVPVPVPVLAASVAAPSSARVAAPVAVPVRAEPPAPARTEPMPAVVAFDSDDDYGELVVERAEVSAEPVAPARTIAPTAAPAARAPAPAAPPAARAPAPAAPAPVTIPDAFAAAARAGANRTIMGLPMLVPPSPQGPAPGASPEAPAPASDSGALSPQPDLLPVARAAVNAAVDRKIAEVSARGPEYEAIAKLSREVIEQVVWEVVPELAELIVREHVEQLAAARR